MLDSMRAEHPALDAPTVETRTDAAQDIEVSHLPYAIVLADANNFFASCETVFNPQLAGRPVVVLSNNDGCVVSRSAAAKQLGIVNGTPWFKIRGQAEHDGVIARSSNYELYASLSHRMMHVMSGFFSHQEVYSIDECFLHNTMGRARAEQTCRQMRSTVLRGVGIAVSVGVAPTKTLAKIANHWAKKHPTSHGVTFWNDIAKECGDDALRSIPVSEVWGVGRRITKTLMGMGITTALDLQRCDPVLIRHRFSVLLERTVLELRGTPCIEDESDASSGVRRTQILCSRMFSSPVRGFETLSQALSVYAQQACHRLHRQHSLCGRVAAFCSTSPFAKEYSHIGNSVILDDPSDNPMVLSKAACNALRHSIDEHAPYIRAGVMLLDLSDAQDFATFEGMDAQRDEHGIGSVLEVAARRFGPRRVGIGYGGIRGSGRNDADTGATWTMRRDMLSIRGTTRWDEMPIVHA
ncbi:Y-family DNA polymerase [Bifidobacterium aquikefiricola]|uniref:DUF4113 domain-containing protein n=1 Tax=Bifidobacterium aquikefiricola TaxID=3059038 RepID=A0AB39U4M3_9BIFI